MLHPVIIQYLPVTTLIKWDHLEILANGRSDIQCKTKENIVDIRDLKPALNENVGIMKKSLFIISHRM